MILPWRRDPRGAAEYFFTIKKICRRWTTLRKAKQGVPFLPLIGRLEKDRQ